MSLQITTTRTGDPKMKIQDFIQQHKEELEITIKGKCPNIGDKLDNKEIRLWILNDEGLYNWARSEGVKI